MHKMVLMNRGTLVGRSWGLKSCLSQQYLEDLSCQTWTGVMVTSVFWFMIGYCLTNQRYLLLITNFDSCMYMNFFISCVKGSVHTNSVDLVLSFLSVKIGLISYHFVPQHEDIKYFFFFWINIIWIEHLIHLKLKTLDQQYANVKRL